MTSTINLEAPPAGHSVTASMKPDELPGEVRVRLFKEVVLFLLAIAFVGIVMWICIDTIRTPAASADEKKWAMSVIAAAAGGTIGYLVRK
ncbi:hypothetical protein V8J36_05975 [Frigidibacter sp. MR17.14]|uniref:hypothetical protein n=1 Tax=Frigidibacter sp. MR17.14 TaxID=3126509 RepID=UPI003012EE65